ncbi:MAG: hypothetical protein EBZ49_01785 [Proteobacteria bacterium]|nr:hypothetical protein [Pseudomonadota bacterium]
MGKTNKQFRSLDEKQHHVYKTLKKQSFDKSVRSIDRALKSKQYDYLYYEDQQSEKERGSTNG